MKRSLGATALFAVLIIPNGAAATPTASRLGGFLAQLAKSGRAEVRIERRAAGGATDDTPLRGRVVLEPPDRVRVDFEGTGERVTLRSDAGEWLQPRLRQLVRLGPARAREALRWWDLLLGPTRAGFTERALDDRRVLLVRAASADSVWVTLDGRDRPARLEVAIEGGGRDVFRLGRWSFGAPRGTRDFVIAPPAGYEVVDLP